MEVHMLVSIALTTYNGARFLRHQLDSVYSQSFTPLEVVAVDDGSTDGTAAILEEYSSSHGLRFLRNEQQLGFVKNFEKAISLCTGTFIALCDQDDIWLPGKIERFVSAIGDHSMVCSDVSLIDEHGKVGIKSLQRRLHIPVPRPENQFYALSVFDYVRGCSCMFRRDLVPFACPIPDAAMSHDWWFAIWATRTAGIVYLPEQLTLYRQQSSNTLGVKEFWKAGTLARYLVSQDRREIFRRESDRVRLYLDAHLWRSEEEKVFLEELHEHYTLLARPGLHAKAFHLLYKNRKRVFDSVPALPMYGYLFARAFS